VRKIVLGENDEIAPPEEVKSMVSSGKVEELVEVIPGADHFYLGKEEETERLLVQLFDTFTHR